MKKVGSKIKHLSDEERSKLVNKTVFLIAHLDIVVEYCDELESNPLVWKLNLKHTGKIFRDNAIKMLSEILYKEDGKTIMDENGNEISEAGSTQEQAWVLIKAIKDLNSRAIEELTEEKTNNGK